MPVPVESDGPVTPDWVMGVARLLEYPFVTRATLR